MKVILWYLYNNWVYGDRCHVIEIVFDLVYLYNLKGCSWNAALKKHKKKMDFVRMNNILCFYIF